MGRLLYSQSDLRHVEDDKGKKQTEINEKSVGESLDYKITGIDPGAGIMEATEKAIEEYELTIGILHGSGATMTAALKRAYDKEQPIVVIGWTPHWKFAEFDLKFLKIQKDCMVGKNKFVQLDDLD